MMKLLEKDRMNMLSTAQQTPNNLLAPEKMFAGVV